MKAARLQAPEQFEVMEVEAQEVSSGQCLIRLESWAVCGTDIRHAYGPIPIEEEYPMKVGALSTRLPARSSRAGPTDFVKACATPDHVDPGQTSPRVE